MCCYQCCVTPREKAQTCPASRCWNKRVPLQPALHCKQPCPCWATPEKRWYRRKSNKHLVDELAITFHTTVDKVIPLVYKLTVREFHDLLYPKGSGWNACRVPFVHSDVCEVYAGLYDEDGNFQDPVNRESFNRLVQVVGYLLCFPVLWKHERHGCGKCFKKKGDEYEYKPRTVKKCIRHVIEGCCWYDEDSDDEDRSGGFLLDTSQYDKDDEEDTNLEDKSENRLYGPNNSYNNSNNNSKNNSNNTSNQNGIQERENNDVIKEISSTAKLKPKKVPRPRDTNRYYLGAPIPVLLHEPFDNTKAWTWVNRHPQQNRLLTSGFIGKNRIERYKRNTVRLDIEKARERFSLHTDYDLPISPPLKKVDMFGRRSTLREKQRQSKVMKQTTQ